MSADASSESSKKKLHEGMSLKFVIAVKVSARCTVTERPATKFGMLLAIFAVPSGRPTCRLRSTFKDFNFVMTVKILIKMQDIFRAQAVGAGPFLAGMFWRMRKRNIIHTKIAAQ